MQTLNIFQSLLFIQDKHEGYFSKQGKSIMNLVKIDWEQSLNITVTDLNIPPELRNDIESLILPLGNN